MSASLAAVRKLYGMSTAQSSHVLDDGALSAYLADQKVIPGLQLPVKTTKVGYGQSNPTYFVDDASGTRYILRKKPAGAIISPVAHQVDREFRVLQALGTVKDFPVPKVWVLCVDSSVIGTPFYIMECVQGRILKDIDLPELPPPERRKLWFSLIETLAWLHSIDPDSIGLAGFGKKKDFYSRQCNTFSRIEAQQATVRDKRTGKALGPAHEKFGEIVDFVRRNVPQDRNSIIHGDFKFDNVILHPTEPRVICILDWELSTLGHPLMDVVFTLRPFWNEHAKITDDPKSRPQSPYRPENRAASGMPDPDELLDRYSEIVGFDPREDGDGRDWKTAQVFDLLRGATISHGIQARTISGQASSEFSYVYFAHTKQSLDSAWKMVKKLQGGEQAASKL
ncbi:uncharacterized protein Z518_04605 [Rhinocladiella mackenziei CBS 650.93]|uniref:Aminoglycoside phosphotransferase domain-containing protein n=1 Tax=Rhinocladiella mackenziei CBS 650.93 TaxID=1442369 RepID=A0A0D2ILL0_9EURO|nr:uncharacterized protein Z518_04605 [Rhinocladiella mackenziei CBS 650.93]KIX06629.1 hypothetical protein Z518_04605 [Rhinocladiella mackenziei CBS 650.93]